MKISNPILAKLETAATGAPPDGYLGIDDLKAALADPNFDWGANPQLKESARLALAAGNAGDTEALHSLGFFQSPDRQWLYDLKQDFSKTLAFARSHGLPAGRLDAIRDGKPDNLLGMGDIEKALSESGFDWGAPQARAYAEYLAQDAREGGEVLAASGFFRNSQSEWTARNAQVSWLANADYTGTSLTTDLLDHVWNNGYGSVQKPQTDQEHQQAMTEFFAHLKQDFKLDLARLGANWGALEPEPGGRDAQAENRLLATLQAAADAGVRVMLGVGAKSASDAGQFREVPSWVNNGLGVSDPGSIFKAGAVLGAATDTTAAASDAFSQRVLGFTDHVMSLITSRLDTRAQDNIVAYQIENEPFNDMGNGSFDPALLKAEADVVRRYSPGTPLVMNHWSTPAHDARPDAMQQAAEIADFVGFDVYAGGTSNGEPWQQEPAVAWQYPTQYAQGITRADGSSAGIFIAELQASTWANGQRQGFVANAQSVTPLIRQAQQLELDVIFWRQTDLEGIDPATGQFGQAPNADTLSLALAQAAAGDEYGRDHTP